MAGRRAARISSKSGQYMAARLFRRLLGTSPTQAMRTSYSAGNAVKLLAFPLIVLAIADIASLFAQRR
jgi:hypothetical protein